MIRGRNTENPYSVRVNAGALGNELLIQRDKAAADTSFAKAVDHSNTAAATAVAAVTASRTTELAGAKTTTTTQ